MIGHDFLPVAGHPDDDECTHRSDGTDATYCGEPRSRHNTVDDAREMLAQANDLLARIVAVAQVSAIEGPDGFVESYSLPVGPIHRAIPYLSGQGIYITHDGQIRRAAAAEEGKP